MISDAADRWPAGLRRGILAANLAAVLLAFALVWMPEVLLYWPGVPAVERAQVEAARSAPSIAVLDTIRQQYLGLPAIERYEGEEARVRLAAAADRLMAGTGAIGLYMAKPVAFPFRAANLEVGLPGQQLLTASMVTTHLLLQAHRATGDPRYLRGALEDALAFATVEKRRLVPQGLLWNDHAMAARISVLVDLWSAVRDDPGLSPDDAAALLGLAQRSAARLAKPALYTFRTNHGVMQNLALLQFAVAFPTLPAADEVRQIGCARLVEQFAYYMNGDGITLEHSAGYHELGRILLERSVDLFRMTGCHVPDAWRRKLAGAEAFSHMLMRPDRTLPAFGNTDHAAAPADESVDTREPPAVDHVIDASAGLAVWWQGLQQWPRPEGLSQTVVTWTKFPSRAHKLDDDMSVLVWAAGRPWITNTGYWPYGVEGYEAANGWRGSNAPFVAGEPARSPDAIELRRLAVTRDLRFIELQRKTARATLRREVANVGNVWFIVDSAEGPSDAYVDRVWTTMPETDVVRLTDGAYLLRATAMEQQARITFLGDGVRASAPRIGDLAPFAGWIVRSAKPTPAPAFELRQRVPGTSVTVLAVGDASREDARLVAASADGWAVALRSNATSLLVRRTGDRVMISRSGSEVIEVQLDAPKDENADARQAIVTAYGAAAGKYPKSKELTGYRYRLSLLMASLVLLQELTLLGVRRWNQTAAVALRGSAVLAWIGVGAWAYLIYLR